MFCLKLQQGSQTKRKQTSEVIEKNHIVHTKALHREVEDDRNGAMLCKMDVNVHTSWLLATSMASKLSEETYNINK